jgi:anti-sigma-K factor RskA
VEDLHSLVAPYALDALDDEEQSGFEQHLALCERCREELAALRETAATLAYGVAGPPTPPELKDRILAQARSERTNVASLSVRRRSWTAPLAAAAALAASVAVGVGVWAATRPSGDPFTSVLSRPGAKLVPLGERGAVAVAPDGDAALALGVSPAPAGKTYEAWVIERGRARRAGIFGGKEGTTVIRIQRPVGRGAVVAVTLERAGGVEQPTQQPLARTRRLS